MNSNQNFAVYRTYEGYTDLQSNIKVGDTVKVYYRSSIMDYNCHVFQVEKRGNILVDYKDYNENASEWTGIGLFGGIIIIIGFIMRYKKFNLIKCLNSLVESKMTQNSRQQKVLCYWGLTNNLRPKAKPVFSLGLTSIFEL